MQRVLLASFLVLICAACGGSDSGTTGSGSDATTDGLVDAPSIPDGLADGAPTGDAKPDGTGLGDTEHDQRARCNIAELASLCCCQGDWLDDPICDDGTWTCPTGFGLFRGSACNEPCGPCQLPCLDVVEPDAQSTLDVGPETTGPEMRFSNIAFDFERRGGIAGIVVQHHLVGGNFYAYGDVLPGTCQRMLTAPELEALMVAVNEVVWESLQSSYARPENPDCNSGVSDMMSYSLDAVLQHVSGPSQQRSTFWCDDSALMGLVPQALLDFEDHIQELGATVRESCD